eukprot:scaffold11699_cov109-Isochrysis_galbana.AAC.10
MRHHRTMTTRAAHTALASARTRWRCWRCTRWAPLMCRHRTMTEQPIQRWWTRGHGGDAGAACRWHL